MSKDFDDWWNADSLVEDNPFRRESPAFWAWEGWHAGVVAEREACAKVAYDYTVKVSLPNFFESAEYVAAAIRARGQG